MDHAKDSLAVEEDVGRAKAHAVLTYSGGYTPDKPVMKTKISIIDLKTAMASMNELVEDLRNTPDRPMFSNLSKDQWDNQLSIEIGNLNVVAQGLLDLAKDPNAITRIALEEVAKKIALQSDQMASAAKNAALCDKVTNPGLVAAAKAVSETLKNTLRGCEICASDPRAVPLIQESLGLARGLFSSASAFLQQARQVKKAQCNIRLIRLLGNCKRFELPGDCPRIRSSCSHSAQLTCERCEQGSTNHIRLPSKFNNPMI